MLNQMLSENLGVHFRAEAGRVLGDRCRIGLQRLFLDGEG